MPYYDIHTEIADVDLAVRRARLLGFDGIAVFSENIPQGDFGGYDIVKAVMLKPKTIAELKESLDKFRSKAEIVAVYGGNYEINRAACEDSRVDLLCHPEKDRIDSGLDHICAKAAAENGVCIEINFSSLLNAKSVPKQISSLRRNIYICSKYGARLVATSGAENVWDMRAPRELASIANVLGLDIGLAIDSVSAIPSEKITVNREKLSGVRAGNVKIVGDVDGKS